jgi:NAD(P)-dependent dehydrogenase (short-subunit alcohol dehydrogenase family)
MKEGRTALITGATTGIGKETAIALAEQEFTIVFTARSKESGEATQREIIDRSGNLNVSFLLCDLSSLDSVRSMCEKFAQQHKSLNILINNAGVMEHERIVSHDGFEMDFAVNYLAPFLLTNLLLPLLKAGSPARIVNVSSSLYRQGHIDFDDLQSEKHFNYYQAYANSKLALTLFTKELSRALTGTGVTVNALHPGVVATRMNTRNIAHMNFAVRFVYGKTLLSPKRGAATSIYVATSPEVEGISGEYFEKKKVVSVISLANDTALAEALWNISLKLVDL